MKIKKISAFIITVALLAVLIGCGRTSEKIDGVNVTVNIEGVYALRMDCYSGDDLVENSTGSYADGEMVELGDIMYFYKPAVYTDEFTAKFTIITAAGREITNDKMEITLPASFDSYNLSLIKTADGEPGIEIFID